ncbi:MAG: PD40 domain-containing protein [Acidobacteriaceae bacterium]|nr:PD40 domain-containing protein [Acidobacteriaceae bacterium]
MNRDLSNWRTFQVGLNGGEPRPLSSVTEAMSPFSISGSHSELLLGSSALRQSNDGLDVPPEHLWSQPLAGGPPRALALRAYDASWSPDGSEIVFSTAQQIGLARPDGTTIRMLAEVPGAPSGLRWSPNGDRIRFTLHYGTAYKDTALWELSPKTGKAHPLFPASKNEQADGEWTPDGRFYLFSQTNNGISQIWALAESTPGGWCPFCSLLKGKTRPRKSKQLLFQLTNGPMQTFLPTPTPDGKRVLFYGVSKRSAVLRRDDRSGRFEPFLPGVSGSKVSFSKDSKWIAYLSYPERTLWRAEANGSNRLQLSPPDMIAMLPAISPDGTKVAFVGWFPGKPAGIFVIERDGGTLQSIVSTEPKGIVESSWSPDSKSLVLGTLSPHPVLYRFDLADKNLSVMPGSEGLWSPRWSPDGQFIASLGSPVRKLMLYEIKSHRQTELAPAEANYPAWSHDGQYVYFRDEAWHRVRLSHRTVERIADLDLNGVGARPAMPLAECRLGSIGGQVWRRTTRC